LAGRPELAADDPGLIRGIGRWALVALTINSIIGSGIFGLPAKVHAVIGPFGLVAYLACAVIVLLIALCFAEVSSRFTRTGGPYLYADHAFGHVTGFAVGWLMWVTRVSSSAAIASIMASYAGFFWAPAATGAGRGVLIALVMGAFTWINLAGIRQAAGVAGLFAVAKIVPLLMFVLVGAFFFDPAGLATWTTPTLPAFSQTMLLLIFAFVGFETTTVAAGEARDPRRDIPFALFAGIGTAAALYVLIQLVCIGTLPGLAGSERPLADAGARMAGALGGAVISLGAVISTTGALHATVITGPRMLYAMALREQLPPVFARTLARHHTPHAAILATSAAGLALALSGTFVYLATLSVIARLTAYVATALALLVFRRRSGAPPAAFRLRAAGLVVALACAACAWLVTTSAVRELRDVAIATAAGFALYAVTAAARRTGSASRG
jgi:amino acid transporter